MGIYSTLEDKWYDFLDNVNEKIPVYKIIDPIDKIVPSFLLFLALILLLIILTIVMLPVFAPGVNEPQFEVNVTVLSSKTGIPLGAVDLTISGNCMGEERIFEQKTNSEGKAKFTICTDDIKIAAKKENYYPSSKPVFLREEKNPVLRLMPVEITDEEKPVFVKIVDEYDDILIGAKLWSVCDGVSLYQGEQTQVGFDVDFGSCSIAQFKVSVQNYKDKTVTWNKVDPSVLIKLEKNVQLSKVSFITENITVENKIEPNVEINIKDSIGRTNQVFTDNAGTAVMNLPVEEYSYTAYAKGEIITGNFSVTSINPTEVKITFLKTRNPLVISKQKVINLLVVSDTNVPIISASINIYKDGNLYLSNKSTNTQGIMSPSVSILDEYLTSSFFVIVTSSGYEKKIVRVNPIDINSLPTKIELKRGENKLTVSVIDDQNSPIKSAIVKVINTNFNLEINESENKTTNNNGVYILQNLPTGDYKISVDTTNASGEKTLKMDANVDKTIEIQLVTGMGFIRYNFVNEEGQKANPKILVYKLENDGNNTQIFSGFPKNGVYDTPKFLVGTKIKILIEDENYFNTETLVYTITRLTQSKEIYLRRINNLPNNNEVQMILEEVYASDPKYGNPAKVDVLLPGKNYFLYFNLLLNTDINAVPISIFYIGDKNKQVLEESSFSIENIDSIIEHITLIDTNMNGPFIDPNSQTITSEGKGKIGNVVFNSIKGKFSIPLILEIRVDENTQFGTLFYYTNFEDVDSLLYKFDFNVGKKFCTNKSKCDPFLFSNYIEHNSVTKPYEEGQTLLIGENYKLKSSIENISDVLYSNIDLVLEIPKEGVEYGLFSNDKNSVVFPLTLNPLSISVLKEETIKPIKARNVWSINQSAKKIIDGVDELKELNDTIKQRIKFSIKNKNTLDIVFSPSIIEERSNYPVFIVNTTIKNGGKISANWKAEKVLPSGETELINSGVTDGNGRQITSFNAINLVKGDIVKFTVFDTNGSNPGTKQITIGSGFGEIEVLPQECLSVKLNSIDLNKNAEYFLDSTINSSNSVEVISDCNEERYAVVKTDLDSSEISLIIPANSKKSFTITSKPRGVLLGAYPVQILSVNGARYSQISYFDIVISDPNSDFELSKAVFDFSEEDVLAGIVTNKKYSGRKDNFYPKMNISTNSVSLNYNKPGIPSNLTIGLEVMATAWEAVSKGRTKSDKIKMTTKEKENWLCGDNKKTSITITHPTEIVNDDGITSAMQEWFEEVSSAEPTPKPEPELDETNPDKPYYSLPKEITDKFISKIIPIEGEVSDLGTDANFSENKKERKILLEGTTGGSAIMNYDLPGGENVLSGVIYDPTGVTNYQEVATFDTIYGCLIPPAVSNKVSGTIFEFYYSNLHDIEGNPIEKFKIPGQTEYVQLKNSCMLVKRVEQVNYTFVDVEKDEKTQIISYGFADRGDNGDCTGPRIYGKFDIDAEASCHVFSNNTDVSSVTIQTDAGDGGTYFFKRWKTWRKTVDLNNIEEGKIYPLGEYSATPELEYQGLTSINDKKAGDSWAGEDNKSFFTVPILGAHGFVPPEFVMENTQRICASTEEIAPEDVEYEKMPDPNSPWVEFDSTGLISYEITPWSIPDGFRVFLKDGVYYGEYLGNIKVDWDPSGADRMVYIQTEPEITSPNIDFTLTKIDLVGNEYAIITVQDWVSGSEKKEAIFQVKLKGPESTCVNSNGEDGYTGAKYIPKFLFKWDFSSINEEQCDSTFENYTYCDGVQFNISLFKKLAQFESLLRTQNISTLANKTTFNSYLIRDNYSKELLDDFSYYFSNNIAVANPEFYSTPGYKKLIDENKLHFRLRNQDGSFAQGTRIPYGGLYRVEIDIQRIDEGMFSMFDGNNSNVNVTVTLMPIEKAKNYNPFYETPFDGEVGKRGDVLHRANYGVGFSEPILLQDEPRLTTNTFTGTPLLNIKSKTSNNILDLEKGIVLKYDLENKELRFNPSIPTPLSMKVKNTLFGQLNAGYNLENVSDKLVNRWVIVGSTIGNNTDKCLDFEGNDNRVFVEQVDGTKRTLSWSNAKEGTVTLATNIFLPKDGNGSVKATSLDKEKVTLRGPYTLGETIWLSGYNNAALTGNYDNLEYLFNQLREEKMCITKGNELVTNIWWNPEYLAEIINNTSKANTDCKLDVYNPFLKIQQNSLINIGSNQGTTQGSIGANVSGSCFNNGTITDKTPKIVSSGQCFKTSSGEAFYPIADTAWLLGKLSNSEIEEYIKKRSEQGFNVIKFSSSEGDFTKHDFIFNTLKKYNMYAETGPDVGQANGIAYVNRYKNRDNLFAWIVGGLDSGASSGDVSALLSSVRAADSTHLISAHPKSGKSLVSDHGISTSLIDFYYVHKCTPGALGSLLTGEINRSPKKPVYLGEPVYEGRFAGCGCTSGCSADQSYSQITEAITAGSAGISHGHHSVWSFNLGESSWGVDPSTSGTPWRSALNSSGSQKIISIISTLRNGPSKTTQPGGSGTTGSGPSTVPNISGSSFKWLPDVEGRAVVYIPQSKYPHNRIYLWQNVSGVSGIPFHSVLEQHSGRSDGTYILNRSGASYASVNKNVLVGAWGGMAENGYAFRIASPSQEITSSRNGDGVDITGLSDH